MGKSSNQGQNQILVMVRRSDSVSVVNFIGLLLLFLVSCNDGLERSKEDQKRRDTPPSIRYPLTNYNEVELYYLDDRHYGNKDLMQMETEVMTAAYTDGLAFIDSSGRPSTGFYVKRILTDEEMTALRPILSSNPQSNTKHACIPFYRDVLIFFKERKQVAQTQICLECRSVFFSPSSPYLFDERNWDSLMALVDRIKER